MHYQWIKKGTLFNRKNFMQTFAGPGPAAKTIDSLSGDGDNATLTENL
jgi:hypothetical protein